MKKRMNEELYDIFYDYEDEEGYVSRNNKEEFQGDWLELQKYIKSMRRNGCYNIDAVYREGSSGEYDEIDESLKEGISDNDIDKVYKKLSKLNKVDFGKLEDEFLKTRPSLKDAVYRFYGTILNTNSYCKDFIKWVKEEKGIDLKGLPCKEGLKEDTIKQGNYWVNKGKEGTHGKFKTKKAADAQRRAMFAQGYKEGLSEDFRAAVDWERLEYELWEVLEKKLGAGAEVYFGKVQLVSSNQSGVTYETLRGDEDAGEEVIIIKGKMFGTPSKVTMTMHRSGQGGTDEVEVYNVDEMADALIKFGNR